MRSIPSADTLQGWLTDAEFEELRRLARGKRVLEIGAWKGRSTVALAQSAEHVVSIDHFRGDGYTGAAFTLPEFVQNLDHHHVRSRVTLIVGDMVDALMVCRPDFNLIFYDADHTGAATRHALSWIGDDAHCAVAVHDYSPAPQYRDAVAEIDAFADRTGRAIRLVDTLAVMEPPPAID